MAPRPPTTGGSRRLHAHITSRRNAWQPTAATTLVIETEADTHNYIATTPAPKSASTTRRPQHRSSSRSALRALRVDPAPRSTLRSNRRQSSNNAQNKDLTAPLRSGMPLSSNRPEQNDGVSETFAVSTETGWDQPTGRRGILSWVGVVADLLNVAASGSGGRPETVGEPRDPKWRVVLEDRSSGARLAQSAWRRDWSEVERIQAEWQHRIAGMAPAEVRSTAHRWSGT
jgi:hypothetical protein